MVQATIAQPNGRRIDTTHAVDTIIHTLSTVAEPGQVIELRIPGIQGKRTDSGYFTDSEKLARAAVTYQGRAEGIYITLNPLNPALLARSSNRMTEYARNTTGDKDVAARHWLFVDFDAVRPAGISASDAEHTAALDRAVRVRDWLMDRHIRAVLGDSGNGGHLLIPVRLPNTADVTALFKAVLNVLSEQFSNDQVVIDTSTVNASRIIKLYGTFACKGDNVSDRPHRQALLLDVPDNLQPVDSATLESLLTAARRDDEAPNRSDRQTKKPGRVRAGQSGPDRAWIDTIKTQLDMVAYAERKLGVSAVQSGHEFRLPGNQGFLINTEERCWYHYGGQSGGDALDLVGYLMFQSAWDRRDKAMFRAMLSEAAQATGVSLPALQPGDDGHSRAGGMADTAPGHDEKNGKSKPAATDLLDIARVWKARYADSLAWDCKRLVWRRWTGTHWQSEHDPGTMDLLTADVLRSTMGAVTNIQKIDSVIRLARALCNRPFTPTRRMINFQNGTLDLESMVGHGHAANDELTECLPYDYAPRGAYLTIDQFLKNSIPDREGQRAYMAHIGLALIGDLTLHRALILLGPPRSGKTTLLKLAQLTLGSSPGQFATAVLFSPESRGANSRAAWIDQSSRLVCLDEFPEEALRDEGEELFKSMTAHGGVSMWLKYHDERIENLWKPKLLFATNNRMRYRDPSGALTRRLLIVECPNALPDNRLDTGLLDRFVPELGAFAAACIALALDIQQTHTYPESPAMRALLADIERSGDAVKLWLSENCIVEPNVFIPTHTLYQNFKWWCEENGLHAVSRPKLRDMVCGSHPGIQRSRQRAVDPSDGSKKLLWGMVGLRLRSPSDDAAEQA